MDLTSWMASIPDQRKLFAINIPGTHDSGTYATMASNLPNSIQGMYHCQALTIDQQLNAGVRFIDLRGYANSSNPDGKIGVCHGDGLGGKLDPTFQLSFDDVLNTCESFVQLQSTETIIILVKCDYKDNNDFNTVWGARYGINGSRQYPWYKGGSNSPELKDVRGKLFLLVRDANIDPSYNARVYGWKDNDITDNGIYIQDYYKANASELNNKVTEITDCLHAADSSLSKDQLVLNYWSAEDSSAAQLIPTIISDLPVVNVVTQVIGTITGVDFTGSTPEKISNYVKPRVAQYLDNHPYGRYGVQVIDFIHEDISKYVIKSNNFGNSS